MVFRFISDSVLSSLDEVTVPQIKNSNSNGHLVYVCALGGRVRQPHTLPLVSIKIQPKEMEKIRL